MPVRFHFPDGQECEVESYSQLNLLAHAQIAERSVQSRCGGHRECGTCRVRIESGKVNEPSAEELELLHRAGAAPGMRLACQVFPESADPAGQPVVVRVPGEKFVDARGKSRR
ncbi:MAG: (2Fe-2S)-binding protein [Deltaproteobacteria bacterium]|nr:(2Fe-2S)-binding protein [Deltaproteobacteria bacterium]